MKKKLLAACMAAVVLLAGCGARNSSSNGAAQDSQAGTNAGGNDLPASSAGGDELWAEEGWDMNEGEWDSALDAPTSSELDSSVYQNSRAKLIRRAELSIQTEHFDQSKEALNKLVASCGGYYEMASEYGGGLRDANANRRGDYTVRVPAEQYSQFFNSAGDLGYVTSRTESSEDVGTQYYDTEARFKTQRIKQERLLELLERADNMVDIIALESALSDVEYQIEMYSSELNRYDALIDFATFTICIQEVGQVTREVGETASLGQRMAAGVQASFRNLGQGFQDVLIWASYNIFLLVILAGAVAVAVVVGRQKLRKSKKEDLNGE